MKITERKDDDIMIRIRAFEETVLDLFGQNRVSGTTHTYIGEEATAVALMHYVREQDKVFSNHRCHGHYIAYGGPERELLAEILCRKSGLCQGRGGSQHIHYKNFYTNGIQGGIVPEAVGMSLADKMSGVNANTVVFLGDGTLGQGVVYESLNIASVYKAPVVFVIEDNQYAMSTPRQDMISGDIKSRIEGFAICTYEITSTDVEELLTFFEEVFSYINEKRRPVCAIVHNYRLAAHSKGDDTRDPQEIALYKAKDPIGYIKKRIGIEEYEREYSKYRELYLKYADEIEKEEQTRIETGVNELNAPTTCDSFLTKEADRYGHMITEAFDRQLSNNAHTVFIGEDIRDPYGGAFKVTKGLSAKYQERVMNMPISEAGMTGVAVGMAMNGYIPVVEMMFGDFATLAFDQVLNHASKYGWVYGDLSVPMILRLPSGAGRGYGPTHSQSLEKFFIGIPLIRVLAMNIVIDPKVFYRVIFETIDRPVIVIENKKLYGQRKSSINEQQYKLFSIKEINGCGFPTHLFSLDPSNEPDGYLITYGGMTEIALDAAHELIVQYEIQVDVIVVTQLSPLPVQDLLRFVCSRAPIWILEEGTRTGGIGAEITSSCIEAGMRNHIQRIATADLPIPNGIYLEGQIVPNKNSVVFAIRESIRR